MRLFIYNSKMMYAAHLPAITSVPLTANHSTRRFEESHLTSSRPRRPPRPGDVYRRPRTSSCPTYQPRPLGLLPNRSLETWKSMMRMLTTERDRPATSEDDEGPGERAVERGAGVPYRHPAPTTAKLIDSSSPGSDDRAYQELLLRCRIAEYGLLKEGSGAKRTSPQRTNNTRGFAKRRPAYAKDAEVLTSPPSIQLEYMNFVGQAQLWNKMLTLDRRFAQEWQPCSRCQERGTKCSHRIVIRTGGGYIILDCSDLSEVDKQKLFEHIAGTDDTTSNPGDGGGGGGRGVSAVNSITGSDHPQQGSSSSVERGGAVGGHGNGSTTGRKKRDSVGRGGIGEQSILDADETGGHGLDTEISRHLKGKQHLIISTEGGDGGGGSSEGGGGGGGDGGGGGLEAESSTDKVGSSSSVMLKSGDSGLGTSTSKVRFSNRPQSSAQRRLLGKGLDSGKRATGLEHQGRRGNTRGDNEEAVIGGDERQPSSETGGEDGDTKKHDKSQRDLEKFQHQSNTNEHDDTRPSYHSNLKPHHSKRNDLKALQCTLKELQGIDPLDYLAKYCIIDQEKLPHYRRVYDNVDRDEDDEIGISELDFALKAVNYELITDAEMRYVHSVLELAGRYKLNFRLFTLVAALSEKVVALEDMVKRLVNDMDCVALETKMKKCKELFYLLADSDTSQHGGVVTTSSLAVELQAGGLTTDHVGYVVERLNHQGKGTVEFLDYLTYVPLFVEIHDSIYGNPLDFSRQK